MTVEFQKSETRENLMRAFAGESQARNRYTFAAQQARSMQLKRFLTIPPVRNGRTPKSFTTT